MVHDPNSAAVHGAPNLSTFKKIKKKFEICISSFDRQGAFAPTNFHRMMKTTAVQTDGAADPCNMGLRLEFLLFPTNGTSVPVRLTDYAAETEHLNSLHRYFFFNAGFMIHRDKFSNHTRFEGLKLFVVALLS